MITVFTLGDGSKLYFSEDQGGIRIEQHGGQPNKCLWGQRLTAEQAAELRRYLEMKGF